MLFAQLLSLMFPQKCVTYIQVCWVRLIFILPPDVEQKGGEYKYSAADSSLKYFLCKVLLWLIAGNISFSEEYGGISLQ